MRNYWSDWHKYDSNYTWWHGNMEMPPALLALCVGNPLIADGCTSLRASKVELCYCLCCQLNQLFNKQLGGQWLAMMLLALHCNSITLEWCPLWAERWFSGLCGLWGFIWYAMNTSRHYVQLCVTWLWSEKITITRICHTDVIPMNVINFDMKVFFHICLGDMYD